MRLALHRVAGERAKVLFRVLLELEPEQRREERVVRIGLLAQRAGELRLQLEADARLGVRDADAEEAAQQLPQRVVRDVLSVGDALRADEARALLPAAADLRDEAGLADAWLAGDRGDRAAAVGKLLEQLVERREFGVTTDQRREAARFPLPLAGHQEHGQRLGLALQRDRADRLQLERRLDLSRRRRTDRDASGAGLRLQAGRSVDRVAERVEALLRGRILEEEHDRARVHADAAREF